MDGFQMGSVHICVTLRGREAGMAEQLLNGAQVAATREQVGRKGMAQRMWRRALWQAQIGAEFLNFALNDPGMERTAANAPKQW